MVWEGGGCTGIGHDVWSGQDDGGDMDVGHTCTAPEGDLQMLS